MKRVFGGIVTAVLVAMLAMVVYVMVCNMQGKVADVFGTSIMKVVSGSMEPSIHVDDYIIVQKTDTDSLEIGDIISFYSKDSQIYGRANTHRIAEINSDGSFVTKGDANKTEDTVTVMPDEVIGKYTGKIRFLRWINSFASGKKLLMVAVIIPMLLVSVYEVVSIAKIKVMSDEEKEKEEQEEKDRLIREAVEKEKQKLREENFSAEINKSTAEDEVKTDEQGEDT